MKLFIEILKSLNNNFQIVILRLDQHLIFNLNQDLIQKMKIKEKF